MARPSSMRCSAKLGVVRRRKARLAQRPLARRLMLRRLIFRLVHGRRTWVSRRRSRLTLARPEWILARFLCLPLVSIEH